MEASNTYRNTEVYQAKLNTITYSKQNNVMKLNYMTNITHSQYTLEPCASVSTRDKSNNVPRLFLYVLILKQTPNFTPN